VIGWVYGNLFAGVFLTLGALPVVELLAVSLAGAA
jgi:hypothetical protein